MNFRILLLFHQQLIPSPKITNYSHNPMRCHNSLCRGVPLRVGLYAPSPRSAAGFALQSLTHTPKTSFFSRHLLYTSKTTGNTCPMLPVG
jgi:hypothetical protein